MIDYAGKGIMDTNLDFLLLDDLLPQVADPRCVTPSDSFTRMTITSIGPLLEYVSQVNACKGRLPSLQQLPPAAAVLALRGLQAHRSFEDVPASNSHTASPVEFIWVPPTGGSGSEPQWIMYLRRVQNAAEQAGFKSQLAKGLTGAFIEMTDNVLNHSENVRSGIAGYRWSQNCFEYVVADTGIGVLASLRTCADYAGLADAGTALQVALTEGESRFGRVAGRGVGFRQVLISLTNLKGSLRFRSGDHVLVIDGTSPDLGHARLHHLGLEYRGLLVSVVCHP
jgi:hypothetical protein